MNLNADPVYAIRNLRLAREKNESRFDLHIDNLEIRAGEFVAIVGESGCGKSALLDLLGLILRPSECRRFVLQPTELEEIVDLTVASESERAAMRARHLGYVLQSGGLLPFLSISQNIALPAKINRLEQASDYVSELVNRLKIRDQLRKMPHHLSGGQRQRAAIARALAHAPKIVLADEPTAAVDKSTALDICQTFKGLASELGVTVVMVTHDTDLVSQIADRRLTFHLDRPKDDYVKSLCVEV